MRPVLREAAQCSFRRTPSSTHPANLLLATRRSESSEAPRILCYPPGPTTSQSTTMLTSALAAVVANGHHLAVSSTRHGVGVATRLGQRYCQRHFIYGFSWLGKNQSWAQPEASGNPPRRFLLAEGWQPDVTSWWTPTRRLAPAEYLLHLAVSALALPYLSYPFYFYFYSAHYTSCITVAIRITTLALAYLPDKGEHPPRLIVATRDHRIS